MFFNILSTNQRSLRVLLFLICSWVIPAFAADVLLTATRPNLLYAIDGQTGETLNILKVPGQTTGSWTLLPSPDNRRVYLTTDNHETVLGLDLATGDTVFRAELGEGLVQARSFYGHDLNSDGSRLFVQVNPVRRLLDQIQVLDNEVLVFDTGAGLNAKPLRRFKVPRRIQGLMTSADDHSLFLLGRDFYRVDTVSGELLETLPVNGWQIKNRSPADMGGHWISFENSGVHTQALFSVHTDRDPRTLEAYQTSIAQLDRRTGKLKVFDFESTAHLIFATTTSAKRPEVFGVYNSLVKIDSEVGRTLQRVPLEATYYAVNTSPDGERVYIGGGGCKVAAHKASDLSRIWGYELPGCADQSFSHLRVIRGGNKK
jgi:quinohemoprotein amine dehydrogenase beta subunit